MSRTSSSSRNKTSGKKFQALLNQHPVVYALATIVAFAILLFINRDQFPLIEPGERVTTLTELAKLNFNTLELTKEGDTVDRRYLVSLGRDKWYDSEIFVAPNSKVQLTSSQQNPKPFRIKIGKTEIKSELVPDSRTEFRIELYIHDSSEDPANSPQFKQFYGDKTVPLYVEDKEKIFIKIDDDVAPTFHNALDSTNVSVAINSKNFPPRVHYKESESWGNSFSSIFGFLFRACFKSTVQVSLPSMSLIIEI